MSGNSDQTDLESIKDRIYGAIFASACANSLGGSGVGMSRKQLLVAAGSPCLKNFSPGFSRSKMPEHTPGRLLADSFLALAVGESLVKAGGYLDATHLRNRFKSLLEDKEFLSSGPSAACLSMLRRGAEGFEPLQNQAELTDVGGACRALPAGCLPGPPRSEIPTKIALEQCRITHSDCRVLASAAVIADSVNLFLRGANLKSEEQVRDYVKRELEIADNIDERFAEAWDGIAPDLDYAKPANDLPYSLVNVQSNVNELIPTAVGIFLIFRHDLEEAISNAALAGGDTDTVAFVVGALSGAYHGLKQIPERWLNSIAHRERLGKLAEDLIKFWI